MLPNFGESKNSVVFSVVQYPEFLLRFAGNTAMRLALIYERFRSQLSHLLESSPEVLSNSF
jgi:hypothetical protein